MKSKKGTKIWREKMPASENASHFKMRGLSLHKKNFLPMAAINPIL
jgi:hypothetical protein